MECNKVLIRQGTYVIGDDNQGYTLTEDRWFVQEEKLAAREAEVEVAESALLRNGFQKRCNIAACNCGEQWGHGGHASRRLSEIADALPYANGKTILERVEELVTQVTTLTRQLATVRRETWEAAAKEAERRQGLILHPDHSIDFDSGFRCACYDLFKFYQQAAMHGHAGQEKEES